LQIYSKNVKRQILTVKKMTKKATLLGSLASLQCRLNENSVAASADSKEKHQCSISPVRAAVLDVEAVGGPKKHSCAAHQTPPRFTSNSAAVRKKLKISLIFSKIPVIFLQIPLIFLQISMIF